jgi:hypothetical protein
MYATLGPNVFYFLSAPLMRLISEMEVFHPSALEFRRKATVEFLGQSIFMDREHGARLAARVLADTPMPRAHRPALKSVPECGIHKSQDRTCRSGGR